MNPDWAQWLPNQRWYAGRDRTLSSVQPRVVLSLRDGVNLTLLDIAYTDGSNECYQVFVPQESESVAVRQLLGLMKPAIGIPGCWQKASIPNVQSSSIYTAEGIGSGLADPGVLRGRILGRKPGAG